MIDWIDERKCAICGKPFYPPVLGEWAYKKFRHPGHGTAMYYFCSWSCLRKFEKGAEIRPNYQVIERG